METDGISIAHLESSLLQVRSLLFFSIFKIHLEKILSFFPLNRKNREKIRKIIKRKLNKEDSMFCSVFFL